LLAISLGTSDTLFGFMPKLHVDPAAEGHVFGSPTGHYMSLICFKNGSLAREKVRDHYQMNWRSFNAALRETPCGNEGRVFIPWFDPEITPTVLEAGPRFHRLDWSDPPAMVRGVLEGQMAAMRLHSQWMGVKTRTIYATGGAAANRDLLQVMADIFDAEVLPSKITGTAALGAAIRAWHADLLDQGRKPSWEELIEGLCDPVFEQRISPRPEYRAVYEKFLSLYQDCERLALGRGPKPGAES
jgi:xylulokinase